MMSCTWPEPIVRVQSLSDSGIKLIPHCYIRRPSDRPSSQTTVITTNIPVIKIDDLSSQDPAVRQAARKLIASASREWGFFQVINHGVKPEVMGRTRSSWRQFFDQPSEVKQAYSNEPSTYVGYGSRLGVQKGATLDWSDYFYLNYLPLSHRHDQHFWPTLPTSCREVVEEYGEEMAKLSGILMRVLSAELGLEETYLEEAFGGSEEVSASIRANFYPKCPQPDLTLGLSPHSDPGGLTLILPDPHVSGLQVFRDPTWFTINPLPNAIIVNIGDQIQILSNAIYKSVEHRVLVNPEKERLSIAFFYNPKANLVIQPAPQIVSKDRPALYAPQTYDEYRVAMRKNGACGKRLK
jgi:isopenicillin N synthase-like dioxygenase